MSLSINLFILLASASITVNAMAHSGGTNSEGCHAGSQPYHCHGKKETKSSIPNNQRTLKGVITHVRDGDTFEVNGVPVRLAALDCPEKDTKQGQYASKVAKQFKGSIATCEMTGAKTYGRVVGYCIVNGQDFGRLMMNNSACQVWEKYDVWDRY